MRPRVALAAVAVLAAVPMLVSGCTSGSPGVPVSLPAPKTGDVTFYLSLPASTARLSQGAANVATPGSSSYRHFSSLATAAGQFGATNAQINTVAQSIQTLGLQFAADPTRLFGRVTGSATQWQAALGTPLTEQAATASNPFITYGLPAQPPAALQPSGTGLLLRKAEVYDATAEGRHPPSGDGAPASAGTAAPASRTGAAGRGRSTPAPIHRRLLGSAAAAGRGLHRAADSDRVRRRHAAGPRVRHAGDHDPGPGRRLAAERPQASGAMLRIHPA